MLNLQCTDVWTRPVAAFLLFAAACAGVAATSLAQEQSDKSLYDLRYHFTKGESVRWTVLNRATVTTIMQGTTQTAVTRSESVKVWEITDVSPDGEIRFINSVQWVKMSNQIGSRAAVEFDSSSDAKPPADFEQAAASVGVPLTEFRIDAYGRIKSRVDKQPNVAQNEDMPIAFPLPGKPIAIGQLWVDPHDVTVILTGGATRVIKTQHRYELKSVASGVATISVTYQVLTPGIEPHIEAQLVQRLASGVIKFDIQAGRILSQQRDVDKRVVGISGAASSMNYVMRLTEELHKTLPEVPQRASRPAVEGEATRE
jgi:hypothetical protein